MDRHVRLEPFSGTASDNAQHFLKDFERYAQCEQWDDSFRLAFVSFYLKGNARVWFDNNEHHFTDWAAFSERFKSAYIDEATIKEKAKKELQERAQRPGESCHDYVQVVLRLCREADPAMSESDKVRHIKKGISELMYIVLHFKGVTTVDDVLTSCRDLDNSLSQRIEKPSQEFTRLSSVLSFPIYPNQLDATSSVNTIVAALPEPCAATRLPSSLEETLERVVKRVVQQELLACAPGAVCAPIQRQHPSALQPSVGPSLDRQCYYCQRYGHVQRFCRQRAADRQAEYSSGYNRSVYNRPELAPRFQRNFSPRGTPLNARHQSPHYWDSYDARPVSPHYSRDFPRTQQQRGRSQSPANPRGRSPYRSDSPHPAIGLRATQNPENQS
jgi:hypothetical protein